MNVEALVRFILDRVAEDGAIAAVASQPWFEADDLTLDPRLTASDARHIERWDPGFVMAECDLKRRVVARCEEVLSTQELDPVSRELALDVLRMLATAYECHADFLEDWRLEIPAYADTPPVIWVRIEPLPHPDMRKREADWRRPIVQPADYHVGDFVTVRESNGLVWRGMVEARTPRHIAIRVKVRESGQ
jgi:hypothetical protein